MQAAAPALNPSALSVDHAGAPPQFARDGELEIRFLKVQRLHKFLDTTTGVEEPRLVEVDAVEIKFPADPTKVVVEEVKPDSSYIRRFPFQWKAYMDGLVNQNPGTALETLAIFNPMELATMQLAGYKTLEQLLGAPTHVVGRMGPGSAEWQSRAKRWQDAQTNNDSLRAQLLALQAEVAALRQGAPAPQRETLTVKPAAKSA